MSLWRRFTRRSLVNFFLEGGTLALLSSMTYPVFRYLLPAQAAAPGGGSARVAGGAALKPGSAKIFRLGSEPAILVRTPAGEFRAFSAVCTHLGCTVQYRPDFEHIWCACHNGHFDLFGKNVGGPPPRPLAVYTAVVRGEDVHVSRSA